MPKDEFWDALKEHAHRNHQERVAKNPDRIAYAIMTVLEMDDQKLEEKPNECK